MNTRTAKRLLIKNARIVNEGTIRHGEVEIEGGIINKIDTSITTSARADELDAKGKLLLPGVIDDQVHFRDPGLRHKATIYSESKAAVAGGTTSFMEMPNTIPNATTLPLLEAKYDRARLTSIANYSFFLGASNDNIEEIKSLDPKRICGVKIFMGSSTGDLLVDSEEALENIFKYSPCLIATHCEDEATVRGNMEAFKSQYGDQANAKMHPLIRNVEGCFLSSEKAVGLAKRNDSRLHILHISTEKELALFEAGPIAGKKITNEACVHHLWFSADDYEQLGNKIKCNPAIKASSNREALWKALAEDRLDIIATDHAPHTQEEKAKHYWEAPSGLPLVQHSLLMMLEMHKEGKISLERIVEKMCHAPADCFGVHQRGYIREGYYADLVLVDGQASYEVRQDNIKYKCKWSPLEGKKFGHTVTHTFVNGNMVFYNGRYDESMNGMRLEFDR